MLEQMRRNSRSFIIWILFGIIIAVFIVSFGPQANPDSFGCGQTKEAALEVAGQEVSLNSWRFAVNGLRGGGPGQAEMRRQQAADLLVERELLAQAAEERGFRVSDEMVNDAIRAGEFFILGHLIRMTDPSYWRDYQQLEAFATSLGLTSVAGLAEEQRREQLAEMMRHLLVRSATVSDEEARQVYIHQNTKVTADYVKFEARTYRQALQLGEADIDRYAAAHDADLKKAWEAEKAQWAGDKPRVLARQILIGKDRPKKDAKPADAKPADAKPGDAKPGDAKPGDAKPGDAKPGDAKPADAKPGDAKPADAKPAAGKDAAGAGDKAPAKQRAEEALARVTSGADFGTVAREVSDDKATRLRGGVMGWRPADSLGQGKEVVDAAKKLAVGQVSGVIETERGYHIIKIEERSDKALTYEQKKADLAARLAPEFYAKALARRDAELALAQAREKPLEQLFERKAAPARSTGLPDDLPPELLKQLEELKSKGIDVKTGPAGDAPPAPGAAPEAPAPGAGPGEGEAPAETGADGKQGFIIREGPNVLAQSGGAQPPRPDPAAKPAAPAAPAPAPAGKPAAPAAPAPAGKPAAPAAPAAPAGASTEQLPTVTVDKPGLQSVGPASRMGDFVAGIGQSEKLVTDLFETLEVGKVAPEVYEIVDPSGDAFAIVVLKSREKADVSKFGESRAQIVEEMTYEKGVARLSDWVRKRCEESSKGGEIKVNAQVFEETEGASQAGYMPCMTLTELSASGQLRNRRLD
jgi:parvulin-like peptidyl-prolyl isomerase